MVNRSAAEIEQALDSGEWLRPGEVGILFGKGRFTVDNWLQAGRIRYRRTPGGQRECSPEDIRGLLDEYRREHRGPGEGAGPARDGEPGRDQRGTV